MSSEARFHNIILSTFALLSVNSVKNLAFCVNKKI